LSLTLTAVFAQNVPDPAVEIKQGTLVLRNVYHAPIQAYAINFRDFRSDRQSESIISHDYLLTGEAEHLRENAHVDVRFPADSTTFRIGVIYDDGNMTGNPAVLRHILSARAVVQTSIPFAVRAFQEAAARLKTLPDLIREVEGWRPILLSGGFSRLAGQRLVATPEPTREADYFGAVVSVHERMIRSLKASSLQIGEADSLPEAADRVIRMLNEIGAALSIHSVKI
jgi:hypothetical protein